MSLLKIDFYARSTKTIAKELLGKHLCVKTSKGEIRSRIVETEAYLGLLDQACHSYGNRRTPRTETMYLEGGHAYVYLIYGMYYCFNVVTRPHGHPEAVLIRGVEPLDVDLPTNGPGKLCRFLEIDKKDNGLKLYRNDSRIWIEDAGEKIARSKIVTCPRIGVDSYPDAKDWPLRFYIDGNRFVSKFHRLQKPPKSRATLASRRRPD